MNEEQSTSDGDSNLTNSWDHKMIVHLELLQSTAFNGRSKHVPGIIGCQRFRYESETVITEVTYTALFTCLL